MIFSMRLWAQCCCGASLNKTLSGSVPHRDAKAIYSCEAEHSNELSFPQGAHFSNGESTMTSAPAAHPVDYIPVDYIPVDYIVYCL